MKALPTPESVDTVDVGNMMTFIENKTGSVYWGKVLARSQVGTKVAPYNKDGLRIAKRAIWISNETHTLLEAI